MTLAQAKIVVQYGSELFTFETISEAIELLRKAGSELNEDELANLECAVSEVVMALE